MPCQSWSLPAGKACPAKAVAPAGDTGAEFICESCYADPDHAGAYAYPCVVHAQATRFEWTVRCMRTPAGQDTFVDTLVAAIGARGKPYFRVHDSGDLFNLNYALAWVRIARGCPETRFWIPTRMWQWLDRPAWRAALLTLAGQPNVTMRPSALRFEDPPPVIPGMAAGTTATDSASYNCLKPAQKNSCGNCRTCWDAPDTAITYKRH